MRKFELHSKADEIKPTKEQDSRNKDFKKLRHQYDLVTKRGKQPIYRDKKRLMLWILIIVILFLIFS